jgi:hypothetical protein
MQPVIEVRGAQKAAVDLTAMAGRGSDIRRTSEKARAVYRKSNQRRFDTNGLGTWPDLKPATVEKKAREGSDARPLRESGALYKAMTSSRASHQIDERGPVEFRFGTTLPYAVYQAPRGRDPLELQPAERDEISAIICAYVARNEA